MRFHHLLLAVAGLFMAMPVPGWAQGEALATRLRQAEEARARGSDQEAQRHFEAALDWAGRAQRPTNPEDGHALVRAARAEAGRGKHDLALRLALAALSIQEKTPVPDPLALALAHDEIGRVHRLQKRFDQAEKAYLEALRLRETRQDQAGARAAAISHNNLGALELDRGRFDDAEKRFRASLALAEKALGSDHLELAQTLDNLGSLARLRKIYPLALVEFLRAYKIRQKHLPKDHPDLATSLNHLGLTYAALGSHERAVEALQQSHQLRAAKLGPNHPLTAEPLLNLANVYWVKNDYAKSKEFATEGFGIVQAALGGKKVQPLDAAAHVLALALMELEEYPRAEELNQIAIDLREKQSTTTHHLAISLNNQALVFARQGLHARAEPLFLRSLEILKEKLGPMDPFVAQCLENLAHLYAATGRWDKAIPTMDEARRILRQYVDRTLPYLVDQEQLKFLGAADRRTHYLAMTFALTNKEDAAAAEHAATWALNAKGLAHEAAALLSLRTRDDAALTQAVARLRRNRLEAAAVSEDEIPISDEGRLRRWGELSAQEAALVSQLQKTTLARPRDPWVDAATVRKRLPDDAALVEIVRFRPTDWNARGRTDRWLPPRYLAIILPARGPARVVDLGEARPIDDAVEACRQAITDAPTVGTKEGTLAKLGEQLSEQEARTQLARLSERVLVPLQANVGQARHWIVSPDGPLWLVPWCALPWPGEENTYLIEKVNVTHVVSGRQLLPSVEEAEGTEPLLIAGPDFNLGANQARQEAGNLLRGQAPRDDGSQLFTLRGLKFAPLPGTLAEVESVGKSVATAYKVQPRTLTRAQALEAVAKTVKRPRLLTFSTHGFFLDPQSTTQKVPRDPLLRCGLALAGANNAEQARQAGLDDGILTGLEIVGMDLRGTELVVLSACETGVGKVHEAEGVMGLRQAFQLAGAQSVLSSLWVVSDRDTALLMTYFFENLAKGEPRAEAFRQAQLRRIRERRERGNAAHPFFWAAFNLTGR